MTCTDPIFGARPTVSVPSQRGVTVSGTTDLVKRQVVAPVCEDGVEQLDRQIVSPCAGRV